MRRRIFENVFQDDEFLDRKEELFNFLYSIGMDSNADESYTDINKDGENDTLMTHFNMGAVTVYVGLCNFSNGEFKYLLYIKSSEGIVLKPTFFDSVEEIENNVSPYIETAYDDTKLSYLGIENEKEYMPSKSEYNDMINSAIDSQDWEEARRIQDKYGKLYESRKKIIRLTESDLSRIVKKVINEQIGWLEIIDALPETGQDVYGINSGFQKYKTDYEKSFSNIFYWAKSKPHGSVPDYKAKIWKLYNAMNGAGTWEEDVTSVLGSLQNMNQLSTLINNWKVVTGSSDSLYSWLIGDMDEEEMCKSFGEWAKKYFVSTNSKMVS
jgi:hypothetical protein